MSSGLRGLDCAEPFSYRQDTTVPGFPDDRPLIVFDGVCVLCSGFARFVVRQDRQAQFRFTAAQSPLGQSLFRHYGLETVNYETNLLVVDGRAFGKLAAVCGIMRRLGGWWRLAGVLRFVPPGIGNWLYDRVARNRYRLFGRSETCIVPSADWRDRMIG
jgi:predicted DCC family thiol-disulfide oxidoreductase YuxK